MDESLPISNSGEPSLAILPAEVIQSIAAWLHPVRDQPWFLILINKHFNFSLNDEVFIRKHLKSHYITQTCVSHLEGMYATVGIKMEFNNVPDLTWSSFKFLAAIRAFNGMQNLKTLSLVFAKPYKTYSHPSPAPRYGPLPANLRSMSIEKLTLDGFHGPLPRWDLPQLQIIISTNRIESQQLPLLSFPANLSEFNQVKYIDMVKFGLQGPIALGLCLSLQYLRLSKNHFNAGIPPEFGLLTSLKSLIIDEAQLTGIIPPELGNLENLNHLSLRHNKLTGSIPSELGNLKSLLDLELTGNNLTGVIPTDLANLTKLTSLRLDQNKLTGPIPAQLAALSRLEVLMLDHNKLRGSLPSELGSMQNLKSLIVESNPGLTGKLPDSFASLRLEELYIMATGIAGANELMCVGNSVQHIQKLISWDSQRSTFRREIIFKKAPWR